MGARLMLLPATTGTEALLVQVPEDYEEHEAYRHVTGIIATIEESADENVIDDIVEALESHGFNRVEYLVGPSLP